MKPISANKCSILGVLSLFAALAFVYLCLETLVPVFSPPSPLRGSQLWYVLTAAWVSLLLGHLARQLSPDADRQPFAKFGLLVLYCCFLVFLLSAVFMLGLMACAWSGWGTAVGLTAVLVPIASVVTLLPFAITYRLIRATHIKFRPLMARGFYLAFFSNLFVWALSIAVCLVTGHGTRSVPTAPS